VLVEERCVGEDRDAGDRIGTEPYHHFRVGPGKHFRLAVPGRPGDRQPHSRQHTRAGRLGGAEPAPEDPQPRSGAARLFGDHPVDAGGPRDRTGRSRLLGFEGGDELLDEP
jgi:hypothetical protein